MDTSRDVSPAGLAIFAPALGGLGATIGGMPEGRMHTARNTKYTHCHADTGRDTGTIRDAFGEFSLWKPSRPPQNFRTTPMSAAPGRQCQADTSLESVQPRDCSQGLAWPGAPPESSESPGFLHSALIHPSQVQVNLLTYLSLFFFSLFSSRLCSIVDSLSSWHMIRTRIRINCRDYLHCVTKFGATA